MRYSSPGGTPTGTAADIPTGARAMSSCSHPETGPGWSMTGGGLWSLSMLEAALLSPGRAPGGRGLGELGEIERKKWSN